MKFSKKNKNKSVNNSFIGFCNTENTQSGGQIKIQKGGLCLKNCNLDKSPVNHAVWNNRYGNCDNISAQDMNSYTRMQEGGKKKITKGKTIQMKKLNKLKKNSKGLHNKILNNEVDVYISIKYIEGKSATSWYSKNREILLLLRDKTKKIKSKNFTIKDVQLIESAIGNFNGIVVIINTKDKLKNNLDKQLELNGIDESIYSDLLLNIKDNDDNLKNVVYDSIFATNKNIERKLECFNEANKKLKDICKKKSGGKRIYKCFAKEVAIKDCINNCVLPYKKSKFIINNNSLDKCIAKEEDKH